MPASEQSLTVEPGAPNVIGESLGGRLEILPLSVEQYDRMIEAGILPEDTTVELLDGILVRKDRGDEGGDPRTVGEAHAYVVRQLARLVLRVDSAVTEIVAPVPMAVVSCTVPMRRWRFALAAMRRWLFRSSICFLATE